MTKKAENKVGKKRGRPRKKPEPATESKEKGQVEKKEPEKKEADVSEVQEKLAEIQKISLKREEELRKMSEPEKEPEEEPEKETDKPPGNPEKEKEISPGVYRVHAKAIDFLVTLLLASTLGGKMVEYSLDKDELEQFSELWKDFVEYYSIPANPAIAFVVGGVSIYAGKVLQRQEKNSKLKVHRNEEE